MDRTSSLGLLGLLGRIVRVDVMVMFDVLAVVVDALDRAGVPHMVSGSVASARHGEARATQDIDLVIDPTAAQMDVLHDGLMATGWYVGDARSALRARSQFNVIDTISGWKVDLIVRKDRPFSEVEFGRRRPVVMGGVHTWMVTAEDSILSKLEWAREGTSERQLRDVRAVIAQQRDTLDWRYLRKWADELLIGDLLDEVSEPPA